MSKTIETKQADKIDFFKTYVHSRPAPSTNPPKERSVTKSKRKPSK